MKTKIILFLFTITNLFVNAQQPIEKQIGDFNTIKVYDLMHISLTKSNENKVIISGEDTEYVQVINKNGILKIRMAIDRIFDGKKTFVKVFYTSISTIDGNEGAKIVGNELIEQNSIILKTQEGAKIEVGLVVNTLDVRAVSGGKIITSGTANNQKINLNTGGIYQGAKLKTETTNVKVKAGGEADVNATNTVNAKTFAGGSVYIHGNPKTVNKRKTFGGTIKRVNTHKSNY